MSRNKFKREDGAMIVEATMVFPVMFLVIFLVIFMGNAYFQKSRIDSLSIQSAYYGATQCADPLLRVITEQGRVPSIKQAKYNIEPYRYLFGEVGKGSSMNKVETKVEDRINEGIKSIRTGLFSGMKPVVSGVTAEFNNFFISSNFEVEVVYKIPLPIRMLGESQFLEVYYTSRCEIPVSDVPEFVRTVDMVEDWVESSETGQKAIQNTSNFMSKIADFIN